MTRSNPRNRFKKPTGRTTLSLCLNPNSSHLIIHEPAYRIEFSGRPPDPLQLALKNGSFVSIIGGQIQRMGGYLAHRHQFGMEILETGK